MTLSNNIFFVFTLFFFGTANMSPRRRRSMSPIEERKTNELKRNRTFDCRICQKNHPLRKCIKFKRVARAMQRGKTLPLL